MLQQPYKAAPPLNDPSWPAGHPLPHPADPLNDPMTVEALLQPTIVATAVAQQWKTPINTSDLQGNETSWMIPFVYMGVYALGQMPDINTDPLIPHPPRQSELWQTLLEGLAKIQNYLPGAP